jgi:hypothetical protein
VVPAYKVVEFVRGVTTWCHRKWPFPAEESGNYLAVREKIMGEARIFFLDYGLHLENGPWPMYFRG